MAQAFNQNSEQYVSHIDAEIERLQQLRNQVSEAIEGEKAIVAPKKPGKRKGMSAEGRLRVAEAQKARWAKQKKAAKKAAKAVVAPPAKKAAKRVTQAPAKKAAGKSIAAPPPETLI